MINLIAIYYQNIGPFENKECSLIFDQGKFLVKAPIGSGKSFLFFDGPSYALYKSSSRNMLNIKSKEGEISLIFQDESGYYLIRRMLKQGKSKDSCSSQFFSLSYEGEDIIGALREPIGEKNIILWGTNIVQLLQQHPDLFTLEEIVLKNETDIQQTLDQLLPPKPVFLSTMFLLQDAENIFEMQPAERLVVLKNVFGLLGIDEAKEQIQDKKREVSYKLKALQDTSQQDTKLKTYLQGLFDSYTTLKEHPLLKDNLRQVEDFFMELDGFIGQISLNDFSLRGLNQHIFSTTLELLQTKEKELLSMKTSKEHLSKQIQDIAHQMRQQEQEQQKHSEEIRILETKIRHIDAEKIELLKKEKSDLYAQQIHLEEGLSFEIFSSFTKQASIKHLLGEVSVGSLEEVGTLIQQLITTGRELQLSLEQLQLKLQNLSLEKEKVEIEHRTTLSQLKEQQKHYGEQLEQAKKRVEQFTGEIQEQTIFSCEKIGANCPFITLINKQHFEQLEQQKLLLQKEVFQWEEKLQYEDFEEKIRRFEETKVGSSLITEEDIKKDIETKTVLSNDIRTFLKDIEYKLWEERLHQKELLQKHISLKDKEIMKGESELQQLQSYQQQKSALESSLNTLQKNIETLQLQGTEIKASLQALEQTITNQEALGIPNALQSNQDALQSLHSLNQLIQDATSTKNLMKDLQQQDKMLGNLYTILSKEILLFALDEYLPILSEIINSFLSQVVEYQIGMRISETNDKLELEAKIFDEKGEREVKSLSGGQRTLLKLVRMLAISSYLQTPLLFLDETINNLDKDTVGKVSEMLNNFVKQRTMKFYTVTHNTEIQEMGIWDKVIEM